VATLTDLEKAYDCLSAKQAAYALLWRYYDGDHPLVFSTNRREKIFSGAELKFLENWCAVVVDAILERLDLMSISVANDQAASDELQALWIDTDLELDEEDVHRAAIVTGESFVIAWQDNEGQIEAYYNDPALVHIQYDPRDRRTKLWAAKWWREETGHWRLTLWYTDRLEYYRTAKAEAPKTYNAFEPMDPPEAVNPTGIIPVFHFVRERRARISELENIIPIQAGINKLLADMFVSAESAAFMQRYVISDTAMDLSKVLKNVPGSIWKIPAGDGQGQPASVGELNATPLQNFLDAIDDLVGALSAISRTPHHYFFGKTGTPSGEALIALEAPLNKKCKTYIKRFSSVWCRVIAFLLQLQGIQVDKKSIVVEFAKPETVQPKTQAEIRQMGTMAGVPLTTILRGEGWTTEQFDQLEQDKADESASQQNSLAKALMAQQRQFDQEAEM